MNGRFQRRRALLGGAALLGCLAAGAPTLVSPLFGSSALAAPLQQDTDFPWPEPLIPGLPLADAPDSPSDSPGVTTAAPSGAPAADPATNPAAEPADIVVEAPDESEPAEARPSETPSLAYLGSPPVKLTIPALGVEATVEAVGQDEDGAMSVPTHPDDVAWYAGSPGMGVPGNVVLAAHVNWDNRPRPFSQLHALRPGAAVQVIDADGRGFEYVVAQSYWVRAEGAPVDEIFAPTPSPVLTLITCGGEFVASRREYLDRLIVRAVGA